MTFREAIKKLSEDVHRTLHGRGKIKQKEWVEPVEDGEADGTLHDSTEKRTCTEAVSAESSENGKTRAAADIWVEWIKYVEDGRASGTFNKHSPEQYGVIWCGKNIKSRGNNPAVPLIETLEASCASLEALLNQQQVLKAPDLETMNATLRRMEGQATEESRFFRVVAEKTTYTAIWWTLAILKLHTTTFAYGLAFTSARTEYVRERTNICAIFFPDEESLESMQRQLQLLPQRDENCKYLADGVVRLCDLGNMEVVLLETSQAYDMTSKTKKSFDLHKAMFGLLVMLRSLAETVPKASFNTFRQLKLYFGHPTVLIETFVRLWSISCPAKDAFPMIREDKVAVPVDFQRKDKELAAFVHLWIKLSIRNMMPAFTVSLL